MDAYDPSQPADVFVASARGPSFLGRARLSSSGAGGFKKRHVAVSNAPRVNGANSYVLMYAEMTAKPAEARNPPKGFETLSRFSVEHAAD